MTNIQIPIRKILVTKLLSCNYDVYIPICYDNTLVIKYNNKIESCLCLPTYHSQGRKYVKLSKTYTKQSVLYKPSSFDSVLAVDVLNKTVWKIPFNDIVCCQYLALNSRWASHIIIPLSKDNNRIKVDKVQNIKNEEMKKSIAIVTNGTVKLLEKEDDDKKKIDDIFSIGEQE